MELSFLAHVRECARGALIVFLRFNSKLVTIDVARRIGSLLQNTVLFLNNLPSKKASDDVGSRLSPSLQLLDFELMVRRRVFQCFSGLLVSNLGVASEIAQQSNSLNLAISSFADPDNYSASSLSSSIASSAGSFESIWDMGDNAGFGVTGLLTGFDRQAFAFDRSEQSSRHWTSRSDFEAIVEQTVRRESIIVIFD